MNSFRQRPNGKPTIDDVAALAGVSYQTVSRVLNGMRDVSPQTREKVQAIIKQVNYRPNRTARQLAGRRSSTIGLVASNLGFYGPAQVLATCELASKEAGLSCMFYGIAEQNTREVLRAVHELCAHQVCGILFYLPFRIDLQELREVCRDTPVVAVDSHLGFECPGVYVDQVLGSRLATRHLVGSGHRHIAYLQGPAMWEAAELRFEGWHQELRAAALQPGPVIRGNWTAESGYEGGLKLAGEHWNKFSAVVAANDQMALGAMLAFEERGISIPRALSIVGFDDMPEASFFRPPLSTVKQDFAAVARLSMQCLLRQLSQPHPASPQYIKPYFIERKSAVAPIKSGRARRSRTGGKPTKIGAVVSG